jgi:ABC-type multidrug transport system fused ATPase/permease subunit
MSGTGTHHPISPTGLNPALVRRLWRLARPYRGRVAGILVLSFVATGLGLWAPLWVRRLIDDVVVRGQTAGLPRLGGALLGVLLLGASLGTVAGFIYTGVTARVLVDLRLQVLRHLARLPPEFFGRMPAGEVLARLTGDVAELQSAATAALLRLVTLSVTTVGSAVLLAYLSWRLFLVALLVVPLALVLARLSRPRTEALARDLRDQTARVGAHLLDVVVGMKALQADGGVFGQVRRFVHLARGQVRAVLRYQVATSLAGAAAQLCVWSGTAAALYYGAIQVQAGALTWGTLGAFVVYLARLYGPLQGFTGLYLQLQRAGVSARRLLEIEAVAPGVVDAPDAVPARLGGEVALEQVTFGYRAGAPVLQELSLRVLPGEVVALVGASGEGKSTLCELLLRLHDPLSGRVLFDGRDARTLRLWDLRSSIGWVSMDPLIFHATVAENLRYGWRGDGLGPDRAALEEAARLADAHRFIAALPEGYDTVIGERGARLSSGQKQRLALARVLLGRPRLLLIDEALSAVDPPSAEAIFGALARLPGTTVLLVTHRQELWERADRVLVMGSGRIVEERPGVRARTA